MPANITTCVDCGDDHPTPHIDPRNPPLDEGKCLCRDCYITAVLEVFDESIEAVENAVQLTIGIVPKHLRTTRLQEAIDWIDNF